MNRISDNMLIDLALKTEAFILGISKYYDMREYDTVCFLVQFDGAVGVTARPALINDTDGLGSDPKVLKTFTEKVIAANPEVWAVEAKAEDLDEEHPFVRCDIQNIGGVNGEEVTILAALANSRHTFGNKLGAAQRFAASED